MIFKQVKRLELRPFFGIFFTFLDNCGANYRVKCSIEKPGFVNLPYSTDHDLLLAEKKTASESQVVELSPFFRRNFLNFEKIPFEI